METWDSGMFQRLVTNKAARMGISSDDTCDRPWVRRWVRPAGVGRRHRATHPQASRGVALGEGSLWIKAQGS